MWIAFMTNVVSLSKKSPASNPLLAAAPHLGDANIPAWLKLAIGELGQHEIAGSKSNQHILNYRKIAGIALEGDDSLVPWCAVFVNAMLAKAGVKTSGSGMARSFTSSSHFEKLSQPCVGCITVISSARGAGSGHVFFYAAENGLFFQALGGNQNNSVSLGLFHKSKLVGHYWPKGQPHPHYPLDRPVKLTRIAPNAPPTSDD
jgi:uncharacterized protein (TIGR02594 family)